VTQPLLAAVGAPSVSQARFAPRPVRSKAAARPAAARSETTTAAAASERSAVGSTRGGSIKWLLLGAAIVIAVAIILVKALPGGQRVPAPEPAAPETGADTAGVSTSGAGAFKAPSVGATQSERRSAPTAGFAQSEDESPPKKAPHRSAARKPPVNVELPAVVPAEPPAAPKAEAVAPPPRVPAPRAVEAPRDPWQAMNEGLARCAREDFFSRIGCEQKLRLQYCVNYWGTVPQCPIGPATDHGQ